MRIGEVAERCGVNTTTIRYYETAGLLPEPDRTPSGYRDYDDATVARLGFIRAAQTIGLHLGEIREVLALRERGEAACPHVIALIEQRAGSSRSASPCWRTCGVSWSSCRSRRGAFRLARKLPSATSSNRRLRRSP